MIFRKAICLLAFSLGATPTAGAEPVAEETRYLCRDDNVFEWVKASGEDGPPGHFTKVPQAKSSFELDLQMKEGAEDQIQIVGLTKENPILEFHEECMKSDVQIVVVIQEALAEAEGNDCPIPHWVTKQKAEPYHALSLEPHSWRSKSMFNFRISNSRDLLRGQWRLGTCRNSTTKLGD